MEKSYKKQEVIELLNLATSYSKLESEKRMHQKLLNDKEWAATGSDYHLSLRQNTAKRITEIDTVLDFLK